MVTITYQPTPKQAMFHATCAKEVLYGGAAGGGKTKALVMDALFRTLTNPGTTACVFRRTYRELEDTDIKEALASYPRELAKYNASGHEFRLTNGSKILFRHCEREADRYLYSGLEVQFMYFDELTSFERSVYDFLRTRNRATTVQGVKCVLRSASNPGNIGHSWVKSLFVDAGPYMSIQKKRMFSNVLRKWFTTTTQYIPALATDNPYLGEEYIMELETKPEALRRALLLGDWDAFEGKVFEEFVDDPEHYADRRGTHVIAPFEIPLFWTRYMSFDHGYTKPFSVGWWACDPDGRMYRYREWYGCLKGRENTGVKLSPRQIADGILARERESEAADNIRIDRIADPSIFDCSRGPSVAQQMAPVGGGDGLLFRAGDNARMAGKMQVHERLRFGEDGRPMLYVFNTCRDFIRTVPALSYSLTKPEDVDTEAEDHCVTGDTLILTDDGEKRIDCMPETGRVIGHDGLPHVYTDLRRTRVSAPVFTLETDDGKRVTATGNHRFLLADGTWKRMDELEEGDELFPMLGAARVKRVVPAGERAVWNMEVEDVHDYVANGIVVHNCYDEVRYCLMARPIAARPRQTAEAAVFDPYRQYGN